MLLTRAQVEQLHTEMLRRDHAAEVLIGGENGGVLLVTLVDGDGQIFFRFDLDQHGEVSEERKL